MTNTLAGGCLCGAVRFEVRGKGDKPHTCSCTMCQKHSGGPILGWIEYPAEAVTWTRGKPATYRSSDVSSRAFCATCGSTLGAIDDAPVVALATGAFDDPKAASLTPKAHSFKGHRVQWLKT